MFCGIIFRAFCTLIIYIYTWFTSKVHGGMIQMWNMLRSQEKCLETITKSRETKEKPSVSMNLILGLCA